MARNNTFFILIACIWLLPFASIQFLPFGIPLYPLEIALLVSSPFLFPLEIGKIFRVPIVRKVALSSLLLFFGVLISYMSHPSTLTGLGQMKSFFFFPMVFWLVMTPFLGTRIRRERVFWHLRQMFALVALSALGSGLFQGLTYDHRLSAWFDSPNLLAMFLVPGAILWGVQILSGERVRVSELLSWFVVNGTLLLTQSYGALMSVLIALVFSMWISREYLFRRQLLVKAAVGLLVISGCIFVNSRQGFEKLDALIQGNERSSFSSREMIWRSALKMVQDSPLTGIGPARFQSVYLEYQRFYPPYLEWAVPHPHNLLLAIWLSSGIVGVCASIWLCVSLFYALKRVPIKKEKALLGALFLGVFVSGLLDVPYFRAEFCFVFWLESALLTGVFLERHQN